MKNTHITVITMTRMTSYRYYKNTSAYVYTYLEYNLQLNKVT